MAFVTHYHELDEDELEVLRNALFLDGFEMLSPGDKLHDGDQCLQPDGTTWEVMPNVGPLFVGTKFPICRRPIDLWGEPTPVIPFSFVDRSGKEDDHHAEQGDFFFNKVKWSRG